MLITHSCLAGWRKSYYLNVFIIFEKENPQKVNNECVFACTNCMYIKKKTSSVHLPLHFTEQQLFYLYLLSDLLTCILTDWIRYLLIHWVTACLTSILTDLFTFKYTYVHTNWLSYSFMVHTYWLTFTDLHASILTNLLNNYWHPGWLTCTLSDFLIYLLTCLLTDRLNGCQSVFLIYFTVVEITIHHYKRYHIYYWVFIVILFGHMNWMGLIRSWIIQNQLGLQIMLTWS